MAADEVHLAFNRKSVSARLATVFAGPLVNIIFAVALYWLFFFVGGSTELAPVVGGVTPGSVAEQAGLQAEQEIMSVDHQSTTSWEQVSLQLVRRAGDTGTIDLVVKQ